MITPALGFSPPTALKSWTFRKMRASSSIERPEMPAGVEDRPAEVWEALLAVADAAGGEWPKRARDACRYFVLDAEPDAQSLGVRLLSDLRTLYGDADRMPTKTN